MITYAGLFLLSAATLAFEVNLTRVFSVAQFYHLAFMIVSLALLGFGASGTFLALFPRLQEREPARALTWLSWGFALTAVGSYALTLYVPFDSFRIAHDWRQAVVLSLHYVALATPFFCSGTAIALLLAARPAQANRTYAANLSGSAVGCVLAVAAPSLAGAGPPRSGGWFRWRWFVPRWRGLAQPALSTSGTRVCSAGSADWGSTERCGISRVCALAREATCCGGARHRVKSRLGGFSASRPLVFET